MDVTDLTRLLLIRHGDCTQTATEPDPGLSELGRMQCELLRDRLMATGEADRASVLVVSPLRRAVESAEILRDGLKVPAAGMVIHEGLREMSWGKAEGWRWEDLVAAYGEPAGPHDPFAPNGESWTNFVRRGRGTLSWIVKKYAGSNIIAVTHTGIIEASFILFASLPKRVNRFEMKPFNTGLSSWASHGGSPVSRWRLEVYNDIGHLWRHGKLLHRHDDYADLTQGGDPFWDAIGRERTLSRNQVLVPRICKPMTNQVTTTQATPDGARRAQTPISVWPAVIRLNTMPSPSRGAGPAVRGQTACGAA